MFFEDKNQLGRILAKVACTVVAMPPDTELGLKNALILKPSDDKKTALITVEQIRDFIALTNSRETSERYFVIAPADAMNEAAENAFLKTFEEPKPHCHFILLTEQPASLLPTILSRAQVFYPRQESVTSSTPSTDAHVLADAKKLIAAGPRELPALASEFAKVKPQPREHTLAVVSSAIELLYKSYFKTKNPKFLARLPAFIKLHESLSQNGHIKLHLVADLL